MPLDIPQSNQLTDIQGEVVAKIGSIQNLLALPKKFNVNIPKEQQISTYDYLVKILSAFGVTPELIINEFLTIVFDEAGDFLEEKVLKALALSVAEQGRALPNTNNPNATPDEKKQYEEQNLQFLNGLVPTTFLQTFKQQMAKDLVILIFGPKDGPAVEALNPDPEVRESLVENAVCGLGLFSVSSDSFIRDEELEFNRIALRKQLEKGVIEYEISCQEVKVKLPEDPLQFFEGGGTSNIPGGGTNPAKSLSLVAEYVGSQVGGINRSSNSGPASKTFIENIAIKLISFISTIVEPYLPGVISLINQTQAGSDLTSSILVPSYCDIADNPDDSAFAGSLSNSLLKELLKMLLEFIIDALKKLVIAYFAETAIRQLKRMLEKQKAKFKIFDQASDTFDKASRMASALSSLATILQDTANDASSAPGFN